MATTPRRNPRQSPRTVALLKARWRLFSSGAIGLLAIGLATMGLPGEFRFVTRMLIGWDVGVGLYLIFCFWMFGHCDRDHIRRQSVLADVGRLAIPALTVTAALASLAAILVELRTATGGATHDPFILALAFVTILLSWAFIQTIFTIHYAHEFYSDRPGHSGGLEFPGGEKPDYWDFVYFSFVIGMTAQVSDVMVSSRTIRKTVTAHGFVSFLFNVALLALTINIAASAM
jgi:uncharacterized membrane protein